MKLRMTANFKLKKTLKIVTVLKETEKGAAESCDTGLVKRSDSKNL